MYRKVSKPYWPKRYAAELAIRGTVHTFRRQFKRASEAIAYADRLRVALNLVQAKIGPL